MRLDAFTRTHSFLVLNYPNSVSKRWKDLPIGTMVLAYCRVDNTDEYMILLSLQSIPAIPSTTPHTTHMQCDRCKTPGKDVWNAWNGTNRVHVCPDTELVPDSKLHYYAILQTPTIP